MSFRIRLNRPLVHANDTGKAGSFPAGAILSVPEDVSEATAKQLLSVDHTGCAEPAATLVPEEPVKSAKQSAVKQP